MKLKLIGLLAVLAFFSSTAFGDRIYLQGSYGEYAVFAWLCSRIGGDCTASKPYNIKNYSKKFCQTQGYGWHVEAVKDNGKAVCNDCSGTNSGKKQCHLEDVVVTCKRIKPGSVGMLPGKS